MLGQGEKAEKVFIAAHFQLFSQRNDITQFVSIHLGNSFKV